MPINLVQCKSGQISSNFYLNYVSHSKSFSLQTYTPIADFVLLNYIFKMCYQGDSSLRMEKQDIFRPSVSGFSLAFSIEVLKPPKVGQFDSKVGLVAKLVSLRRLGGPMGETEVRLELRVKSFCIFRNIFPIFSFKRFKYQLLTNQYNLSKLRDFIKKLST